MAGVLILALPIYLLVAETDTGTSAATPYEATWVIQFGIIVWAGLRLAAIFWRGRITFLALSFWTYVYVFLGVAPFAQIYTGIVPGAGVMSRDEQLTAEIIIIVGLLAYELGSQWRSPAFNLHATKVNPSGFNMRRVWILAIVGLAFAVLFVAIIGPSSLFVYRSERSAISQASFGGSPLGAIVSALAAVPMLIALLGFIDAKRRGEKGHWVILILLLTVLLVLTNPISSSRFWLGVVVGSIAIAIFGLGRSPKRFRLFMIGMLFVFVIAFPYADLFRSETSATEASVSLATEMSDKLDYDSFAQIALTDRFVSSQGHTLGSQLLGAVVAPLPRAWWSDKPRDTGIVLGEFAQYWFTSISAPLWAEAWIDGGWVWLAIVFFGLGRLSRFLDLRYSVALHAQVGIWLTAVPVFALYQIMTLRGSFLQQTPRLVLLALLFWWVAQPALSRNPLGLNRREQSDTSSRSALP